MTSDPLRRLASRYIWWKAPELVLADMDRLIVQVMDIGTLEDASWLLGLEGEDKFRSVPRKAEAGQLRPKSWAYWHYKLGLTAPNQTPPPMPVRVVQ